MSASRIRWTLHAATPDTANAIFTQQAALFQDELLGVPSYPEAYVDLFVELVSAPHVGA